MGAVTCAWVFAGGDFSIDHLPVSELRDDDQFICVDRGVEYCLAAGQRPSILIGDFDSVSTSVLQDSRVVNVERHVYSSRKSSSDLELALELLAENPPDRVVLLGISGGRTDHLLFNWTLPLLRQWPYPLEYIDATTHGYVLYGEQTLTLDAVVGQTISLLALSPGHGVTTHGLQYALKGATILPGSTLGLSNLVESTQIGVEIKSGTLLVMVQM